MPSLALTTQSAWAQRPQEHYSANNLKGPGRGLWAPGENHSPADTLTVAF